MAGSSNIAQTHSGREILKDVVGTEIPLVEAYERAKRTGRPRTVILDGNRLRVEESDGFMKVWVSGQKRKYSLMIY